ncbi:MAG TPA: selenocysteine-specific translation elongation factor [Aggregatilineaceae bacterium]|nr:selenocysteine-specific translation elongation factor [Aggregatilineaceae bacterium]
MHVIGTAGHVDHGKSTLTYALTGINPDRLAEEQRREMTIDIGFAWLDLPDGERVGIIDVPGHRDFIENMLAGVGGIDAAILVIGADEGVMPQTREHLAILDLLAIPTGLIALTKIDLVQDLDWLELVQLDIMGTVRGTLLDGQPIIPVSARTGEGLDRLVAAIADMVKYQPARPDVGQPRLPIDRVFTISGFGVVVTGTLLNGALAVGQEVEIQPSNIRARIRGLQSHEQSVEHIGPGRRAAVNLRGIEKSDLARGEVLGLPGTWHPTTLLDAWLRYLPGAHLPLEHNDPVKLFVGAAEVTGHVRVLDREHVLPGEESWIQIRLDDPIVAARGDRYIVRRASPPETIGGGVILDTAPGQRWKRFRPEVIERLRILMDGDSLTVALLELAQLRGPVRLEALSLDASQREQALASGRILAVGESGWVIHAEGWRRLVQKAQRALGDFHASEPLRLGMPRDTLRGALRLEPDVFDTVLGALVNEGHVAVAPIGAVYLPDHEVRFTAAQEETVRRLRHDFDLAPYAPPTTGQAREIVGDAVLASLIERGDLVRISDDVLLTPDVLREWIAFARDTLDHGEALTVAVLRDHFQTTRRYALDFLERLDALGITRRKGDERVLGSGEWDRLL